MQKTHSTTTTVKYDETGTLQAARLDKVPQVVTESTSRYRIRKLTPRECWRLQGFTDDQLDKARSAGVSDSQLYKQAGNAVTVNVTHAIAQRLVPMIKSQEEVTEWVV
ncbi:DNA cytosine methyltransferase [Paenibacillus larvae]|uniref:DNA cytosine methyltransferase n=1 Tax=Paenibacillus larvae TaxID=1464 RepID=UPI0028541040|nr:DNA cytosine methyltransferase [Paenibacillus larvae]MDR5583134.1 DNA cytosine methyltransferase [Paenibacillus larvae]